MSKKIDQETIVNHFKNYGFVYQNSEIYNGLANAWDFGPLGSLIKNNLKNLWLKHFIYSKKEMHLIDTNIILNPLVWKASGHIDNFSDPLIDCKECKSRFRADKLILENTKEEINEQTDSDTLIKIISDNKIKCPNCKKSNWTEIRKFNLMFDTSIGVVDDKKDLVYLRPETAQGIFINFKNIQRTQRQKLPFGVGQIGKAFRNEITPGNFIFRTREFEQMEIEYFCDKKDSPKVFDNFLESIKTFLFKTLKIHENNIKIIDYPKEELAHYSSRTVDFLYNFPHGYSELWGLADRGEFDLTAHQNLSKKSLEYLNEETKEKFVPSVIEPSVGVERLLYAILIDAYDEEKIDEENNRVVLKLIPELAPYKFAVLPLSNKLNDKAEEIFNNLILSNICTYDSSGSIGKRYRRQDAIGTPYCITVDFDTLEDECVTIRDRDSMKQIRIKIKDIDLSKVQELFKNAK
ncbi:glycine--tRNA ligase [Malacoplasma penetrans]|uniref:Glycine--tRNA ligase n=1 Tax=Malacoplasma penetrans (strain HF-2) TaxID=272633 RepID=SYG_MALP2|nr:glycine--tRNA ligase [Malacoplasma penetrans]Q8EW64.1 RecName: Full=Glycine--tRNA ligase; AltName: Full=Glycyl-tRNA synthetase; Short=GlyRS [Malacoplasma penetrans HF-2]RXY96631.1 glycine--tRNA ligase [Malacoplasma penetrans]BAC44132.1 glycyl-tRNA synthetase [Malacoplasma penetrans HF-2]